MSGFRAQMRWLLNLDVIGKTYESIYYPIQMLKDFNIQPGVSSKVRMQFVLQSC